MLADSCIFRFLFESPKREAREIVSWKIIIVHQLYVNKYELGLDFAYTFLLGIMHEKLAPPISCFWCAWWDRRRNWNFWLCMAKILLLASTSSQ